MIKKTVIINRAVPGSGKTTITNCIIKDLQRNGIDVALHSTDEFFMTNGKYVFDIDKLGTYHEKNLAEFKSSLQRDISVVICDNTNLSPWETEPYTSLARKYDYQVVFITLDPRELEQHVASQKVSEEKPDAHGVKEHILKMMIEEYNLYDALLDTRSSIDPDKHLNYVWDQENNTKVASGKAKHFLSDHIIRILPNEYHSIQKQIGTILIDIIIGTK